MKISKMGADNLIKLIKVSVNNQVCRLLSYSLMILDRCMLIYIFRPPPMVST